MGITPSQEGRLPACGDELVRKGLRAGMSQSHRSMLPVHGDEPAGDSSARRSVGYVPCT